jgi:hypothetical protein
MDAFDETRRKVKDYVDELLERLRPQLLLGQQRLSRRDRVKVAAVLDVAMCIDTGPKRPGGMQALKIADVETMLNERDVLVTEESKGSSKTACVAYGMTAWTRIILKFYVDFIRPTLVRGVIRDSAKASAAVDTITSNTLLSAHTLYELYCSDPGKFHMDHDNFSEESTPVRLQNGWKTIFDKTGPHHPDLTPSLLQSFYNRWASSSSVRSCLYLLLTTNFVLNHFMMALPLYTSSSFNESLLVDACGNGEADQGPGVEAIFNDSTACKVRITKFRKYLSTTLSNHASKGELVNGHQVPIDVVHRSLEHTPGTAASHYNHRSSRGDFNKFIAFYALRTSSSSVQPSSSM